jgi:hypothetical protein
VTAGLAWYESDRESFLARAVNEVVGVLAHAATAQGLHIEPEQTAEWVSSVGVLQEQLSDRLELIKEALSAPGLSAYSDVVLEFDFRRRGLRLDCVLLGEGIIAVLEFKRTTLTSADREQVSNYCINLLEFHAETRRVCEQENCIVVPLLVLTGEVTRQLRDPSGQFHDAPWASMVRQPLECHRSTLSEALRRALDFRRGVKPVSRRDWLQARFSPSSSILDAAISLYGAHDVSAISQHAAPIAEIDKCTEEVAQWISRTRADQRRRIIFVSGAPGAGKTLVGLRLAFDQRFREQALFVTGNAPLVEVLNKALTDSYLAGGFRNRKHGISGYSMKVAQQVIKNADFKIVKAHRFLGERGSATGSVDGSVVIFDEAQRTYEQGRKVLGRALESDEAELILTSLEKSYRNEGTVVVALVGHQQAINAGELGMSAWLRAASKKKWEVIASTKTLELAGPSGDDWSGLSLRPHLSCGHLSHSLRYYRNKGVEEWVSAVMDDRVKEARSLASAFPPEDRVLLTRDLQVGRAWARKRRVGTERAGLIASSQARRLAAEGVFVDHKPEIASWMLEPTGDVRSSNMLESVQTQFNIQGLEIDYSIVCWDLDLRRKKDGGWASFKMGGANWKNDKYLEFSKNSYRVLLTRARKGMVIFVPRGDHTGEDETRPPECYDDIATHLSLCGAVPLSPV